MGEGDGVHSTHLSAILPGRFSSLFERLSLIFCTAEAQKKSNSTVRPKINSSSWQATDINEFMSEIIRETLNDREWKTPVDKN